MQGEGERGDGFLRDPDLFDILEGVAVDQENAAVTGAQSENGLERVRGDVVSQARKLFLLYHLNIELEMFGVFFGHLELIHWIDREKRLT